MHKSITKWSVVLTALALSAAIMAACQNPPTTNENTSGGTGGQSDQVSQLQTQVAAAQQGGVDASKLQTQVAEAQATIAAQANATQPPTQAAVGADRHGGWFDTIVIVEESNQDTGIQRMLSGDIDLYLYATGDPEIYKKITDNADKLGTIKSVGNYYEITFNPYGPTFQDGSLNPFSDPKIREAMNWLIDRNHISQEILGGLAQPRFTAIGTADADYVAFIDTLRATEAQYAFNEDKAKQVIATEMGTLKATAGSDGKWQFNGKPVKVIALIRTEDKRKDIGDYVSDQLEKVGFTVDRQYKTSAEARVCWLSGDPKSGCFGFYTAGWVSTAISRDDGGNFAYFYTQHANCCNTLTQAYTPAADFDKVSEDLLNNNFKTMDERADLFRKAIPMSMQDSVRVFLVDQITVTGYNKNLVASGDLAGGIAGSYLWGYTLRRQGQVGGALNIGEPSILTDVWNPIQGSNWIYDAAIQYATGESGSVPDPFTGLYLPHRVESATVTIGKGLPVTSTLDWVKVTQADGDTVVVPDDAWSDWDAKAQTFIAAKDKYPDAKDRVAKVKVEIVYPKDLFDKVTWHDGSKISMGDFVMGMILAFDEGYKDSPYYDEALTPLVQTFMDTFRGVKIVSTDPLTIDTYTNTVYLDAETAAGLNTWWPKYTYGEASWPVMQIALMAEGDKKAAFTPTKAEKEKVEQTNFISGPTLQVMADELKAASDSGKLIFEPTLSQYIKADEIKTRFANLTEWFRRRGHFWVNTGPYFLQHAFPVEKTVILENYTAFPDLSTRYSAYAVAPIPVVALDGPSSVKIGDEAKFTATVTFNDQPYKAEDIKQVIYLVFDASGNLALKGDAKAGDNGTYTVTLSKDDTAKLAEGSNSIQIVVVSKRVGVPVFASQQFVTTK